MDRDRRRGGGRVLGVLAVGVGIWALAATRGRRVAGLGDVVAEMTRAVGVRPCGGCKRRAAVLNRWVPFGKR